MLHRKARNKRIEWKNSAEKAALCVIGARQIGTTPLIRKFGRENHAENAGRAMQGVGRDLKTGVHPIFRV